MQLPDAIRSAISDLPQVLQPPATRFFERLGEQFSALDELPAASLAKLVAISDFAATVLLRDGAAFFDRYPGPDSAFDLDRLVALADDIAQSDAPQALVKSRLRQERNRQLAAILWRDVDGGATVGETLAALTSVADHTLRAACSFGHRQLQGRHGVVRDPDGQPVPFVVLGMGKFGGGELNFSSDIDVIFTYAAEGESDGERPLPAQKYFDRLSRLVIDLMDDVTADGFVFRMDTRLRPFGESGPPVVSFAALEGYLLRHGRDWERYAYVKAAIVGPRPGAATRKELIGQLVRPFVYRGYLDFGVFESLRDMHSRIRAEGQKKELSANVKLGPGGIREIEFIVQSVQLVRGGDRPALQTTSLLEALQQAAASRGFDEQAAVELEADYLFLRRLENVIQAMRDKQTHDIPSNAEDRTRLCLALGFPDWPALAHEINAVRDRVGRHFNEFAFRSSAKSPQESAEESLAELWRRGGDAAEWQRALEENDMDDAAEIATQVSALRQSPATAQLPADAARRLAAFIPRLLLLARACREPGVAVRRCLGVTSGILRRSAYLALLNENAGAAQRFVQLCDSSAYIADELARFPVLLDELLDPAIASGDFSKAAIASELQGRISQRPGADSEELTELLAQFQRATMFRIAVADCSGNLPIMRVSDSLTWLAEVILGKALEIAWNEMTARFGTPQYELNGDRHVASFGVVAYGKMGGIELSYGSDLDIVFLHDSEGGQQVTDGDRQLDNSVFFSRLARRLVHFLATRTTTGALYEVDTRLRPSGRKGLLVTSCEAFSRYQEENAWTWEHQALLRARPVAGGAALAGKFQQIRRRVLTHTVRRDALHKDVLDMRERMRRELDDSNAKQFNLKHGPGGIGDIEFLVQYLILRDAGTFPDMIEFTDNIRQLNALAECGALPLATASRMQEVYRQYRRRQHHLALNSLPGVVEAGEFAAERQFVTEAWQSIFEA